MLPRMPPKRIRETSAPGPASRTPGLSFCPRPLAQSLWPRSYFGSRISTPKPRFWTFLVQTYKSDAQLVQTCKLDSELVRLYKSKNRRGTSWTANLYVCTSWAADLYKRTSLHTFGQTWTCKSGQVLVRGPWGVCGSAESPTTGPLGALGSSTNPSRPADKNLAAGLEGVRPTRPQGPRISATRPCHMEAMKLTKPLAHPPDSRLPTASSRGASHAAQRSASGRPCTKPLCKAVRSFARGFRSFRLFEIYRIFKCFTVLILHVLKTLKF